jgi:hypothetical protein
MTRKSLSGAGLRSPFLFTYMQEGENEGYVPMGNGTNITVNAAQNKLLRFPNATGGVYTPPVDAWLEVMVRAGLVSKTDAAYNYAQMDLFISPVPIIGAQHGYHYLQQHSQVQAYEGYTVTKLWGLAAGVGYAVSANWVTSGGTWSYYNGPSHLLMTGKVWAR